MQDYNGIFQIVKKKATTHTLTHTYIYIYKRDKQSLFDGSFILIQRDQIQKTHDIKVIN